VAPNSATTSDRETAREIPAILFGRKTLFISVVRLRTVVYWIEDENKSGDYGCMGGAGFGGRMSIANHVR